MSHLSRALQSLKLRVMRSAHRKGQTLVEYALILAIISVVAVGALVSLGNSVKGVYSSITSVVASAAASH